jgi:hypothetical protein
MSPSSRQEEKMREDKARDDNMRQDIDSELKIKWIGSGHRHVAQDDVLTRSLPWYDLGMVLSCGCLVMAWWLQCGCLFWFVALSSSSIVFSSLACPSVIVLCSSILSWGCLVKHALSCLVVLPSLALVVVFALVVAFCRYLRPFNLFSSSSLMRELENEWKDHKSFRRFFLFS